MAKNNTAEEVLCLIKKLSEVERNKLYGKFKKLMFAEQDRKEEEQYKSLYTILQDDEEWGHD
jgi:hypothetical protein